jgi:hypothetical protein
MAKISQTLTKLVEFTKEKKNFKKIPKFFGWKRQQIFFRGKKSVSMTFQKEGPKKTQKAQKTIILNLDKGYLWPTQKGPWAERPNCPAAGFWEMGAKGSIRCFCTSSLWLPNSLLFIGETSPNFKFQIRKGCDFGAFQLPEVREFFYKISRFLYLVFSVSPKILTDD